METTEKKRVHTIHIAQRTSTHDERTRNNTHVLNEVHMFYSLLAYRSQINALPYSLRTITVHAVCSVCAMCVQYTYQYVCWILIRRYAPYHIYVIKRIRNTLLSASCY